jgi:hypothetical protein
MLDEDSQTSVAPVLVTLQGEFTCVGRNAVDLDESLKSSTWTKDRHTSISITSLGSTEVSTNSLGPGVQVHRMVQSWSLAWDWDWCDSLNFDFLCIWGSASYNEVHH